MQDMIGDLLDFAALEADALRVEIRPGSLHDVVRDVCRAHAAEQNVTVACDIPDGPGRPVALDEQRVYQLLQKLLDNAMSVSPPGGVIRVSVREADDAVVVRVADEGPPVADAERERLFDPFHTGEVRVRSGAGLALAIARGIMTAHGGSLVLVTESGRGSSFEARFPVVAERVS
jgi:signal transduction histidine kinase